MRLRDIPGTDLRVSCLGLGGWLTFGDRLDDATSHRLLREALDGGVNFLDLADVYGARVGGAERVVGAFLRDVPRQQVVVSSKVFWPTSEAAEDRGLSRRHVHAAIDRTLANLGLEHLDVYYCHREDRTVPLAETVEAMGDLVRMGKVRTWGTSCWRPEALAEAHSLASQLGVEPPRLEQPQYNLLERGIEHYLLPVCARLGMGTVAFSPLACGVLTGKYVGGVPAGSRAATTDFADAYLRPQARRAVARFAAACRERGVEPAVASLAWTVRAGGGVTSALFGATSERQLRTNLAAAVYTPPEGWAWIESLFPMRPPLWRRAARWLARRFGR
jgi:aryl-alcohol dehydrogenase-like predicted oxidoreductase